MKPNSRSSSLVLFAVIGGAIAVSVVALLLIVVVFGTMQRLTAPKAVLVTLPRNYKAVSSGAAEELFSGDYRSEGRGFFRRVIVFTTGAISYDAWAVTPKGTLQHSRYFLFSPTGLPIASSRYLITGPSGACGTVGLSRYRDANGPNPDILILSLKGAMEPFDSGGVPFDPIALERDRAIVARLAGDVTRPNFYRSLSAGERSELKAPIPQCAPAAAGSPAHRS